MKWTEALDSIMEALFDVLSYGVNVVPNAVAGLPDTMQAFVDYKNNMISKEQAMVNLTDAYKNDPAVVKAAEDYARAYNDLVEKEADYGRTYGGTIGALTRPLDTIASLILVPISGWGKFFKSGRDIKQELISKAKQNLTEKEKAYRDTVDKRDKEIREQMDQVSGSFKL